MALLQKLKSLLGLTNSSSERGGQRDVGVTVEREGDGEPATTTENAVKGTEAGNDSAPAGADATASTGSTTDADAEPTTESPETTTPSDQGEAAPEAGTTGEPAETAVGDEEATAAEPEEGVTEAEPDEEATKPDDETTEAEDAADESPGEDVQVIKGIGPAYADRLADVGIDTVDDLATADAEAVAAETDLSAKRIGQWIERAKLR